MKHCPECGYSETTYWWICPMCGYKVGDENFRTEIPCTWEGRVS